MTFVELKVTLEKLRKGEFDVRPKWRKAGYYCIFDNSRTNVILAKLLENDLIYPYLFNDYLI